MSKNDFIGFALTITAFVMVIFLMFHAIVFIGEYTKAYQLIADQQVTIEYLVAACK